MGSEQDAMRDLVLRMYDEVWNKGNLAAADDSVHPEFTDHPPTRFFDVEETISDGDQIIVRWTARGTNTGDYFGIPPSGKPIEITGMNSWVTRDGKAIEGWVNRDDMGLMQQLGVIPTPG